MNKPALANLRLVPANDAHPLDALDRRERDTVARIECRTIARVQALVRYTDGKRRDLDPGYLDALRGLEGFAPGHFATGAQDFACFVLSRGRWPVSVFLDWMGEAVALPGPPPPEREVDQLIELLQGLDAVLVLQSAVDADDVIELTRAPVSREDIERTLLARYRGRFFASRLREPHFACRLSRRTTPAQMKRIEMELP